jgi:uncharacterized protein YkwD
VARLDELGTPPQPPKVVKTPAVQTASAVTTFSNVVNISSRETSRQFFNLVYGASENVPVDWSGSIAGCVPGTNSTASLQAVARRVNYFRAMAGIPSSITFSNEYSRKAQLAALIMSANNNLSHTPPANWTCWTQDGYDAAGNSNLSLGSAGPDSVVGQLRDNGANNTAAGHRRWILYPQTRFMGSGSVPANGPNNSSGVLWVFDPFYGTSRPSTRDNYICWPPPGFVPYPVAYARWSFAFPGADFNSSTLTMTSNGVPLTTARETVTNGFGENTLVWVPAGLDANNLVSYTRPATDTVYHVTLNNVLIGGTPQSFAYNVTVFDPSVPGADYHPALITGPAQPIVSTTNVYSFSSVSNANGYEWRQSRLAGLTFIDGAENGLTNFIVQASTNDYSVRDSAVKFAGNYSFHLAHPQPVPQILTLNRLILAATNSSVSFRSELGYASDVQTARVQISLDGGANWQDIYAQAGSNGPGESTFTLRTIGLASYAGRTLRLRLNYDLGFGSYYIDTFPGVGWYVDDLTLSNCQEVLSSTIAATGANRTFGFSPTNTGPFLLEVRPLLFGDYPSEWGPSLAVSVAPNVTVTSLQKGAGNTWNINFSVTGTASSFELWSAATVDAPFARETSATIQTVVAGAQYRAVITSPAAQKFYRIRAL